MGDAIESVYAERLQPHHGALGAHYRQGEVWDKALRYLRQAGKDAVACSANREALAYFGQALAVLEHLPAGRSKLEQSYDLQMNRASVFYSLGELQHIVDHLDDWEPALGTWLAPAEDALRPLMLRWLAHRFGTPMVNARGELREAADSILHVHGCALRFASAFGAALERPVDRTLFKVALGAAEFFYRSLHLPREALPWFAAAS